MEEENVNKVFAKKISIMFDDKVVAELNTDESDIEKELIAIKKTIVIAHSIDISCLGFILQQYNDVELKKQIDEYLEICKNEITEMVDKVKKASKDCPRA